jgi:hypothetical protein
VPVNVTGLKRKKDVRDRAVTLGWHRTGASLGWLRLAKRNLTDNQEFRIDFL